MMQAQGILIRDNVRTIGAQVYEQVVRSAYAKRNSSVNDSGMSLVHKVVVRIFHRDLCFHLRVVYLLERQS